jgi:hypothetical protein
MGYTLEELEAQRVGLTRRIAQEENLDKLSSAKTPAIVLWGLRARLDNVMKQIDSQKKMRDIK